MTTLTSDIRFAFVQFYTDFLQHLTLQNHLANLLLAVGEVGTYQIPSLLAQFAGLQLFCGTVQDILLLLRAQSAQQVYRLILLFILQVGKHVQCLLLFFPQLLGLSEFLGDDRFPVIDPYIQNHQETYQNSLDAEEQHGDLRMREGNRYHWQQSDGKAESGSVELLTLGGNSEYKHDKDITVTLGSEFNATDLVTTNPITDLKVNGTYIEGICDFTKESGFVTAKTTEANTIAVAPSEYGDFVKATSLSSNAKATYLCLLIPQTIEKGIFSVSFKLNGIPYTWASNEAVTLAENTAYTLALTVGKEIVVAGEMKANAWETGSTSNVETE